MTAPSVLLSLVPVLPRGRGINFGLAGDSEYAPASGGTSGGWQIVDRPRQVAATQWYDRAPWALTLPLIMDGGHGSDPRSVEADCALLESWTEPAAGQVQPPVLQISGPVPNGATARPWVVNTVSFKAAIRNPLTGERTQQILDVTLWEYVATTSASPLTRLTPAQLAQQSLASATASNIPARRTYVVRKGDTLASIAAVQLGDQSLWPLVAQANGMRDPRNVRPGQVLVIP